MAWKTKEFVGTRHKEECRRVFKNYDLSCARCLELKSGEKPRPGWNDEKLRQESMRIQAIHNHYLTAEGKANCAKNCGPVCVKFDY